MDNILLSEIKTFEHFKNTLGFQKIAIIGYINQTIKTILNQIPSMKCIVNSGDLSILKSKCWSYTSASLIKRTSQQY